MKKILIEIADDDYNRINSYPDGTTFYPITLRLYKAIKEGTPIPTGFWISIDEEPHEDYECDQCGFIHTFIDGHTAQYNYCPNCGKRMKSDKWVNFAEDLIPIMDKSYDQITKEAAERM